MTNDAQVTKKQSKQQTMLHEDHEYSSYNNL